MAWNCEDSIPIGHYDMSAFAKNTEASFLKRRDPHEDG
jgi:hypothetical protein